MRNGKLLAVLALLLLVLSAVMLPVMAQDEEAEVVDPIYGIPEAYEEQVGDDGTANLTSGEETISIISSASYAAVIAGQEFESDEDELRFFLDRTGYGVSDAALDSVPSGAIVGIGVSLSRREQQGAGYLYDLGRDRFAVISLHTGRGQVGAPADDVETVVGDFEYLGTIVDIAVENAAGGEEDREGLSSLVTALQNADPSVLETLGGDGNYTVFAPTNQAFINLFTLLRDDYGISRIDLFSDENQALLTQVLLYHVVEGDNFVADVAAIEAGAVIKTLLDDAQDGIVISFDAEGTTPRLNSSIDLVTTDILAANGVIHVIDDVLLPQCVLDTLAGTGSCGAQPADE